MPTIENLLGVPSRLSILAFLSTAQSVDFTTLKDETGLSSGNLSTHLTKLEDANLVTIDKSFRDKRPCTTINLTDHGRNAFLDYVERMERYYSEFRKQATT
ncbi:MAG: transcriptional regulator [Pseudomonadota bacterium]